MSNRRGATTHLLLMQVRHRQASLIRVALVNMTTTWIQNPSIHNTFIPNSSHAGGPDKPTGRLGLHHIMRQTTTVMEKSTSIAHTSAVRNEVRKKVKTTPPISEIKSIPVGAGEVHVPQLTPSRSTTHCREMLGCLELLPGQNALEVATSTLDQ